MKIINSIAFTLTFIGALSWGLIGISNFNFITCLFGADSVWTKLAYDLIGLAAIYVAVIGCRKIYSCCENNTQ